MTAETIIQPPAAEFKFVDPSVILLRPNDLLVQKEILPLTMSVFNELYTHKGSGFGILSNVVDMVDKSPYYPEAKPPSRELSLYFPQEFNQLLLINGDRYDSHSSYIAVIGKNGQPRAAMRYCAVSASSELDIFHLMNCELPPGPCASEGRLVFNPSGDQKSIKDDIGRLYYAGIEYSRQLKITSLYVVLCQPVYKILNKLSLPLEPVEAEPRYGDREALATFLKWPQYWLPKLYQPDFANPKMYQIPV